MSGSFTGTRDLLRLILRRDRIRLPLWLVGMPLAAWWALLRCPLPTLAALRSLRRDHGQARRRSPTRTRKAHTATA